jgi:hypothetical protein
MKNYNLITTIFLALFMTSCVQKSYKQIIKFTVVVNGKKDIKTVGVRGKGKPFNWYNDLELTPIVKDSLYTAIIETTTGYKFAEVKFAVDGNMELEDKPNRKVIFSEKDTTYYNAIFNTL